MHICCSLDAEHVLKTVPILDFPVVLISDSVARLTVVSDTYLAARWRYCCVPSASIRWSGITPTTRWPSI